MVRWAYRAYERALTLRARLGGSTSEPGPEAGLGRPLPPIALRVLTVRETDTEFFLTGGREDVALIRRMLSESGTDPDGLRAVLDFGCGCGRLARWWLDQPGTAVYGCDYNEVLADWCAEHLPGLRVDRNGLRPPLPYGDDQFDLVYALSVLTHLGADLQDQWLAELRRVLRPDGHLLITVSGASALYRLSPEERARFEAGELVERFEDVSGSNVCEMYHPRALVERLAASHGFEVRRVVEASDPESPSRQSQDAYLLAPGEP